MSAFFVSLKLTDNAVFNFKMHYFFSSFFIDIP